MKNLQSYLKKKKISYALFIQDEIPNPNMFYFSGYGGYGALVVPAKKPSYLLVPEMEYELAKEQVKKAKSRIKIKKLKGKLLKQIPGAKNTALDYSSLSHSDYKQLKSKIRSKTKDISKFCQQLRETKSKDEIKKIKKACQITQKIIDSCIKKFNSFKTESEAAAYLVSETYKEGCKPSFDPIIASGKNSSKPHHIPQKTRINKGFCIIDYGVKYEGYCADITRTIYVGRPTEKEKELYSNLNKIQKDVLKRIKADIKAKDLDLSVRKQLGKLNNKFIHALGHGIGIEVHESPNISGKSKEKLEQNSVLAIEPAIYLKGRFGIRIEDDVLVGKDKGILISKPSNKLKILSKK
ncbi:M24 family metallopeptidase [Nanoarchaeota archaeon]